MELKGLWLTLIALVVSFAGQVQPAARADSDEDVVEAAVHLFHQCTVAQRDGTHNLLLKAVRHLQDPDTRSLFEYLTHADHPGLKIHGILGLAELDPDKQVDLSQIAQIDDPAVQSTVITAAMDDDLLSHDQARQMLAWDGLADEVKILIAIRLVKTGAFTDTELCREALIGSKKLGGRALAALLLTQLDDPQGLVYLREVVDHSDDPQRDVVRAMLLQTALKDDFDRIGGWGLEIAKEPDVDPALGLLGLSAALRFHEPGAIELWQQRYRDPNASAADRVRLALTAMRYSPWLGPEVFEDLKQSDDPLLAAIGQVGGDVASGSAETGDAIAKLIEIGHPMVNSWALGYARDHASEADAQVILLSLILAYEHSPARGKARRLDEAIQATQVLYEDYPDIAVKLLRPILTEPDRDELLNQAILLGLVRARAEGAERVVQGIEDRLNSADARDMAVLLEARSDRPLTELQMDELALLARGGGRLEDSLRIQAAWSYLKRTGNTQKVLQQVLSMESQ